MSGTRPPPLPSAEVLRRFEPRPARTDDLSAITRSFFVAGGSAPPRVEARVVPVERPLPGRGQDALYEVVLNVDGVRLGARASARPIEGKGFRHGQLQFDPRRADEMLTAFQPNHLAL